MRMDIEQYPAPSDRGVWILNDISLPTSAAQAGACAERGKKPLEGVIRSNPDMLII
jgi:hypothetical protein